MERRYERVRLWFRLARERLAEKSRRGCSTRLEAMVGRRLAMYDKSRCSRQAMIPSGSGAGAVLSLIAVLLVMRRTEL
jgi:hypothetical protein